MTNMAANTMSDVMTAEPCIVNFHMLHKAKLLSNSKACLSITPFLQAIQATGKTLFIFTLAGTASHPPASLHFLQGNAVK
jgi:hypothetical protein